jgi:hypothetical protein
MTTQTTYNERIAPPLPGTIAGQMDNAKTTTGICETAAPGIPFGRAVSQGTLSDYGVVLGGTVAKFRGVSIRDVTLRGDVALANLDAYQPPNSVGVLEGGDIWVAPSVAVTAHSDVTFDGTTGLFGTTGAGLALPAGSYWKTSCGVGGMAILSIPFGKKATG